MKILLTFIGDNDCFPDEKPGAILSVLRQREFDKVYLFYNRERYLKPASEIRQYCETHFPKLRVDFQEARAENPTDYNTVYPAMYKAVRDILKKNTRAEYSILLTSGTPAMHACWIFLREGGVIDANLIQVSRESGISEVTFELDDFPDIQQVPEIKAEMTRLARENEGLKSRLGLAYDNIIGESPEILKIKEQIRFLADTNVRIFIRGESGTGKELVAEAIHYNSSRKEKPLLTVNCGAIPQDLFESEFFGHEKGAFTGAVSAKDGKFKLADGGTIFLDEVADLPLTMQVKLLRVLSDGNFTRVGGVNEEKTDVRVISATNKDLREKVRSGDFREDLFYRLVRKQIFLPPLRDRGNDKVMIAQHIVEQWNKKDDKSDDKGRNRKTLDKSAIDLIVKHHWPGNVRQLESALETAYAYPGNKITAESMEIIDIAPPANRILIPDEGVDLGDILRQYYDAALEKTGKNAEQAAKLLGLKPHTFRARLRKLGGGNYKDYI
ncbi:sigma-54 dependent transcriptional regulator [Desulfobacterales bacterium HSG2]|nr:sigma-54 dependent transcriptional regulator [Desulfobacterales bacterium HSG2]